MNTLIQANIFFFITSIAVVVFLILGSICFFYIIGILRNIKKASDTIERQIENASAHTDSLYHAIKESALFRFFFGNKKKSASRRKE